MKVDFVFRKRVNHFQRKVALSDRTSAGNKHNVRILECSFDCIFLSGEFIRYNSSGCRLKSELSRCSNQSQRVCFPNFSRLFLSGVKRHQFISGTEDCQRRFSNYGNMGETKHSNRSKILWTQTMSGSKENFPLTKIFSLLLNIFAIIRFPVDEDLIAGPLRVFLHDNRICTRRKKPTSGNSHRLTGAQQLNGDFSHCNFANQP